MKDKTYIKRWKQVAFNLKQIDDTKRFLESPIFIDFTVDCIFSINDKGDCTFYVDKETIQECNEFGKRFDWVEYMDNLVDLRGKVPISEIIEYYFILQPEITDHIPEDMNKNNYTRMVFEQWEIKHLQDSGYIERPKDLYPIVEVLGLKRIILRSIWEKFYYQDPYKICKKAINFRLTRGVTKTVIQDFTGIEESKTGIYYKFNPFDLKLLSGKVLKIDEKMEDVKVYLEAQSGEDKILVLPNARPELVKYFSIKNMVGFISEEGGATAHSVVIARERNIPCAVGVPGIMDAVNTGDLIQINMETDSIEISRKDN